MSDKMHVLVTGGSGRLAQVFSRHEGARYRLRLTYHSTPIESDEHEVVQMDVSDYDDVLAAMEGVDAVIHFAADSRVRSPWESVVANNITGTYNVYEAAHQSGVKRIVFASSNHAAGYAAAEGRIVGPDAPIRPDSLYGVSKCFGEALARYYHDRYDLQIICLRIGSCHGEDDPADQRRRMEAAIERGGGYPYNTLGYLGMWLSNRDMSQLVHRSLQTQCPFGVFYGISDNIPATFDLSETKRVLGYAPQDNVQDLFDEPLSTLVEERGA